LKYTEDVIFHVAAAVLSGSKTLPSIFSKMISFGRLIVDKRKWL